ncbi:Fe-S cluster assembly protein SufD [Elioraea sp.]|uniref:Fe-S cluster assembly protein SufD n=1 Tax=Elioraea sp. TaxID=2185103 RepID=UPI003F6E49D8
MDAPVVMPAVAPAAATLLDRYAGLKDRLPGARVAWVEAWRNRGAEAFRAGGFPTRRVEAWKFTDLTPLRDTRFVEALLATDTHPTLPEEAGGEEARIVLLDGRFRADLSRLDALGDGVRVESLAVLLADGDGALRDLLGTIARSDLPLPGLNAALAEDGAVIRIAPGVDAGRIRIVSLGVAPEAHAVAFHPRSIISLGAGASLTLLDGAHGAGKGVYWQNAVTEIALGEGARLTHVRVQDEARDAFHTTLVAVRVEAKAEYDSFTLVRGARLARNEVHAVLVGPKAALHLNGAQLVDGERHADTTTVIDHAAPDCESNQTVKTVLTGRARGVFQGKIHVHQVAQKTDGYQMNQALLLSPEAEINSKPQLEIYADDVKCSHGATVGELDHDQLFYLRSRGIAEVEAKSMLVQAFLTDAVSLVSDEALRETLLAATDAWWDEVEHPA